MILVRREAARTVVEQFPPPCEQDNETPMDEDKRYESAHGQAHRNIAGVAGGLAAAALAGLLTAVSLEPRNGLVIAATIAFCFAVPMLTGTWYFCMASLHNKSPVWGSRGDAFFLFTDSISVLSVIAGFALLAWNLSWQSGAVFICATVTSALISMVRITSVSR